MEEGDKNFKLPYMEDSGGMLNADRRRPSTQKSP